MYVVLVTSTNAASRETCPPPPPPTPNCLSSAHPRLDATKAGPPTERSITTAKYSSREMLIHSATRTCDTACIISKGVWGESCEEEDATLHRCATDALTLLTGIPSGPVWCVFRRNPNILLATRSTSSGLCTVEKSEGEDEMGIFHGESTPPPTKGP